MTEKPLTDEELDYWASAGGASAERAGFEEARHLGDGVVQLVAEVRRLREESDSSLRVGKAAADLLLASDEARARAEAEVRQLRSAACEGCSKGYRLDGGLHYDGERLWGACRLQVLRSEWAELERLRGDEWLERAVDDLDAAYASGGDPPRETTLAILRKHRDGT